MASESSLSAVSNESCDVNSANCATAKSSQHCYRVTSEDERSRCLVEQENGGGAEGVHHQAAANDDEDDGVVATPADQRRSPAQSMADAHELVRPSVIASRAQTAAPDMSAHSEAIQPQDQNVHAHHNHTGTNHICNNKHATIVLVSSRCFHFFCINVICIFNTKYFCLIERQKTFFFCLSKSFRRIFFLGQIM